MYPVRAKKHLGQHFLKDDNIARKIVASLNENINVLEIGPGTGILTNHLLQIEDINLKVIEIDKESVEFLKQQFPLLKEKIISADFLKSDLKSIFDGNYSIIGNFPYNISSQILFKVLEERNRVIEVVGMFQKEVASRIASKPGSREYGILSVLLQAYYNIEYLFTVNENVFLPPPKVKSAVVRLTRNGVKKLDCNEDLFFKIVKTAFNQRRKMLRNALSVFGFNENEKILPLLSKRAEQLNVKEFVFLAQNVFPAKK